MPAYSLSSATDAACSTKPKWVMDSRSRVSSLDHQDSRRRGVSEDAGAVRTNSNVINNSMSKAAAWMWHSRGMGDAHVVVLPTKQLRPAVINASSNIVNSGQGATGAASACTQPSRFQREANTRRLTRFAIASDHQQAATSSVVQINNNIEERRPSAIKLNSSNDLYDEFELSCLQELLETEKIDNCQPPCPSISTSIKPLSALHKLFNFLYTTVHNINTRNSAIEPAGRPSSGRLIAPRKLAGMSVQHVIHHHHHHYHRSLDLLAHDHESPYEPTLRQEFVRRRRQSYDQSCSQARRFDSIDVELDHLVDD